MDEWNRHCRSGRQCGSAIQGLDRIWARYLTDWVHSAITVAVAVAKWEGYGKLLLRVEDVDSHGDAIAQRRAAGVPCDKLKSFCRMTVRNHRDVVERRHFVFIVVHQLQFDGV